MKKLDIDVAFYDAGNGFRVMIYTEPGYDGEPVHHAVLNLAGYGIWEDMFGMCGDLDDFIKCVAGNLDAEKAYYFAELAGIEL